MEMMIELGCIGVIKIVMMVLSAGFECFDGILDIVTVFLCILRWEYSSNSTTLAGIDSPICTHTYNGDVLR